MYICVASPHTEIFSSELFLKNEFDTAVVHWKEKKKMNYLVPMSQFLKIFLKVSRSWLKKYFEKQKNSILNDNYRVYIYDAYFDRSHAPRSSIVKNHSSEHNFK